MFACVAMQHDLQLLAQVGKDVMFPRIGVCRLVVVSCHVGAGTLNPGSLNLGVEMLGYENCEVRS